MNARWAWVRCPPYRPRLMVEVLIYAYAIGTTLLRQIGHARFRQRALVRRWELGNNRGPGLPDSI